ncbi:VOC family protein [Clostridium drakei]|uniref:Glyoxalase/bleomycin resistance/dioxygenase family protein n=1 Tax=Clostridium drakei TaxID=332101 RepID=A0A2U8DL45_9CLOT|nr:glyoxalase/bleomycin resistance/dioxygenase family protein [Clostridium drakei]AWI03393.1 glyoxalase/bleomycin resistance/dioxygenase family protein [Clostridium drakei]
MKVKQILERIYVNDMDQTVAFYESLLDEKCSMRFKHKQFHLELVQVGSILIICGTDEVLESFKNTKATFIVDSITEFKDFLLENDVTIMKDVKKTPTGFNMIVEYVEQQK